MNTFNANRSATPNTQPLNSQAPAIVSAQRYRSRDVGIGYGRSRGYARSHSLWSTGTEKRVRYC